MSSMEHQEVNLGQQQNQDLIWDLDSIARRELAERFAVNPSTIVRLLQLRRRTGSAARSAAYTG